MKIQRYVEYCTGCGLCKSACGVSFQVDEKGYPVPLLGKEHKEFCKKVCPAGGAASAEMNAKQDWGDYKGVYLGWSTNEEIRQKASSGGVLTALCCCVLETRKVDGIIQTRVSNNSVYGTEVVISRNKEDVMKCMGSRYSISSPLSEIKQLVKEGEVYAFVGKPCDASALRMYLKEDRQLKEQIKYIFSFFCAGQPSVNAQKKLLSELGCKSENECTKLQYRGNGWPGYATAIDKDGKEYTMSYTDSWGKILGRDIRKICRFCLDGIGEFADIACGDAWYLDKDGKPDFSEADGRNIIIARTTEGEQLVHDALESGYIVAEDYVKDIGDLKEIQQYQYERKATMGSMVLAMALLGKRAPAYNRKVLREYARKVSVKKWIKKCLGTMKRVLNGKI